VLTATKESFYETNVSGVRLLLKVAASMHVPRFVFLSSIAVTNHFTDANNVSEAVPLPSLESLESPYDCSKQMGEKLVLEANGKHGMATIALRAGGILLSPTDYIFKNYFMIPGVLLCISGLASIDFIAGQDVARGMLLAAKALQDRPCEVSGQAYFLTKGESATPAMLMDIAAEFLGWLTVDLPDILFETGCLGQHVFHEIKSKLGFTMPGVPPHKHRETS